MPSRDGYWLRGKLIVGDGDVVAFFRDLRIRVAAAGKMFGENFDPGFSIRLHDVHGFDLRFDIAADDVWLLADEFFRRNNAVVLEGQVADIRQDLKPCRSAMKSWVDSESRLDAPAA